MSNENLKIVSGKVILAGYECIIEVKFAEGCQLIKAEGGKMYVVRETGIVFDEPIVEINTRGISAFNSRGGYTLIPSAGEKDAIDVVHLSGKVHATVLVISDKKDSEKNSDGCTETV